jgi:hypothetical protein
VQIQVTNLDNKRYELNMYITWWLRSIYFSSSWVCLVL